MPRMQCEVFGSVIYPESLSYQELLSLEEELLADLNAALAECGAQFGGFFQDGDFLRITCAFPGMDVARNRDFALRLQACLPPGLALNLLFVDKNLGRLCLYSSDGESMREQDIALPGPRDALFGRNCDVLARRQTPAGWIAEGALPGARREARQGLVMRPAAASAREAKARAGGAESLARAGEESSAARVLTPGLAGKAKLAAPESPGRKKSGTKGNR